MRQDWKKIYPNLKTTSRKKKIFDSFKDDLAAVLEYSREHSLQNNAIYLSRVAHIIWNESFEKHWHFTGSFTDNCQNGSISASLLSLIHRITGSSYDPNSKKKLTEQAYSFIITFAAHSFQQSSSKKKFGNFLPYFCTWDTT